MIGVQQRASADADGLSNRQRMLVGNAASVDCQAVATLEIADEPLPVAVEELTVLPAALGIRQHNAIRRGPTDRYARRDLHRHDLDSRRPTLYDQIGLCLGNARCRQSLFHLSMLRLLIPCRGHDPRASAAKHSIQNNESVSRTDLETLFAVRSSKCGPTLARPVWRKARAVPTRFTQPEKVQVAWLIVAMPFSEKGCAQQHRRAAAGCPTIKVADVPTSLAG